MLIYSMSMYVEATPLFVKKMKKLRKQQKVSQDELAFRAGLHRTYISMIERGVRIPTLDVCDKIAKALGTSVKEML